jgi:uncharacterized protein YsxB (DUF464 family)
MIRVMIERSAADRTISAFSVSGHADYAEPGKDIVCAAVSAVTVGTVNAVESLLGIALESDMRSGWLCVTIPEGSKAELNARMQLILESMVVMMMSIQDSYGKYIKIQEKYR